MDEVYVNPDDFLDGDVSEEVPGSATEYVLFAPSALDETVYQAA